MASLYFLGNYVMLAIVVVLSTIFDVLFRCCILIMLIAWRFNLTSRCSFIRRLTIVPVFLMYLPAGTRYFVYPAELSGDLWSLGFLKIFLIFLNGLKIVRILCLFNTLLIRSVVSLIYRKMNRILSIASQRPLSCLHNYLGYLFCPFFCKASFRLSSVCRCFLSAMMKALCTNDCRLFLCFVVMRFGR